MVGLARRRRTASGGLVAGAALALFISLLAAPSASGQNAGTCGYGTGGPSASSLCWFDLTGYDDVIARSPAGQPTSITLPGGFVASFTLTSRPVPGDGPHLGVAAQATPLEERFAYGSSGADGGYRGVPGKPALYSFPAGGTPSGVSLTLSNITVVDSGGQPVTGYRFVIADAENNINGENFTFTSDKALNLVGVLNDDASAGCNVFPNNLAGLGTTTVTCTGSGVGDPPPVPLSDAVVVGADTPSTIGLSLRTPARSGVAFAIQTAKIQVTKQVDGRLKASDAFDVFADSPQGAEIARDGTGAGDSATTGELTVLPLTGGASYTLGEEATSGSGTDLNDYRQSWSCTNNGAPYTPTGPTDGTSVTVAPEVGDDIECTVTNTPTPRAVTPAPGANTPAPGVQAPEGSLCFFGNQVTILGTNGPDRIVGTSERDVINGRSGKDVIVGLGGDDLICGGRGDDLIKGGRGDDRVKGSLGDDVIRGNLGDDWLRGARGDDVISGRQGNDRLMGNAGDDRLRGRHGTDTLLGGPGTDFGHGGPGRDRGLSLETPFSVGRR